MAHIIISAIFIFVTIITLTFTNLWNKINDTYTKIKVEHNFRQVVTCVEDVYRKNYSLLHEKNYYESNASRFDNGNAILFESAKDIFWMPAITDSSKSGWNKREKRNWNDDLSDVINSFAKCVVNNDKPFMLVFNSVTPLTFGNIVSRDLNGTDETITTLPVFEMYVVDHRRAIEQIERNSSNMLNTRLGLYGDAKFKNLLLSRYSVRVKSEEIVEEIFRDTKKQFNEIVTMINEYIKANTKNKRGNAYAFENGVIDKNITEESNKDGRSFSDIVKTNGSLDRFFVTNGLFFISTKENYAVGNSSTFKGDGEGDSCKNINVSTVTLQYGESGRPYVIDEFDKNSEQTNNFNQYDKLVYGVCKIINFGDKWFKNFISGLSDDELKKIYPNMDVYMGLNNRGYIRKEKVYNEKEDDYEPVRIKIRISNAKQFFKDVLNIDTTTLPNIAWQNRKPFEFLIDNSSYELYRHFLEKNPDAKLVEHENYIRYAIPLPFDKFTDSSIKANFLLEQRFEFNRLY